MDCKYKVIDSLDFHNVPYLYSLGELNSLKNYDFTNIFLILLLWSDFETTIKTKKPLLESGNFVRKSKLIQVQMKTGDEAVSVIVGSSR